MMELIKNLDVHVDDRGPILQIFNSDMGFDVKRSYIIYPRKNVVRAFHGHLDEWKAFYVATGFIKFVFVNMENPDEKHVFNVSDKKPQLIILRPRYFNGIMALEDNSTVICFSNFTYEESLKDDIRVSWDKFGKEIWEVQNR